MHLSDSQLMITSNNATNQSYVNNAGRFRSEIDHYPFNRTRKCCSHLDTGKGFSRGFDSLTTDSYTDSSLNLPDEGAAKNTSCQDGSSSHQSFDSVLEGRRARYTSPSESAGIASQASDASEDYFSFDYLSYNPTGAGTTLSRVTTPSAVHLENPERETRWYFKYFLGRLHQLYCGYINERDPFLLAVARSDVQSYGISQYRSVLWRKTGSQKLCISHNPSTSLPPKKVLNFFEVHRTDKGPKEILNFEVQKDALNLEEQEGSVNFKFGVLYCIEGQTSDEEMYNNEHGSEAFNNFIKLLGDRVNLKSWDRFRGGLDTKTDTTGIDSVYTIYDGHEIMFHISTLLPYSTENRQQIERKRHVGNDIVNIIFVDGCLPNIQPTWSPSMMKTHFTHIFAIVSYISETASYSLNVFSEESVPMFGPSLPNPPEFSNPQEFREFLLVKLINGEKAAFHSPVFAQKRERTLEMLLHVICSTNLGETTSTALNRRAFSDVVVDSLNGITTGKEQNRNDVYIRFGQMLKLNTIIRGDAPTSCINSGQAKKDVWQPRRFHTTFQNEVVCGDVWGEQLIVSTEYGTFVVKEHQAPAVLLDRSIDVKQLEVIDPTEVLVIRYDKGRESRIAVLPLVGLDIGQPIDRVMMKKFCLEKTRGCHLFALSKHLVLPARMAVVVHRKILIYQWQLTTGQSLSSWNQFAQTSSPDNFQFVREVALMEHVNTLSFLEGIPSGRLCIGHRNQFEVWDERTRETYLLYRSESSHNQVVCAKELWNEEEPELILCFTRTCHIQRVGSCLAPQSMISPASSTMKKIVNSANAPTQDSGHSTGSIGLHRLASDNPDLSGYTQSSTSEERQRPVIGSPSSQNTTHPQENIGFFNTSGDEKSRCTWEFDLTWNFEPKHVAIIVPYLFAFARTAIEVRLINNGSLVRTMLVPDCHLIAYKNAYLLFSSTSENLDDKIANCSTYSARKSGGEQCVTRKKLTTQKEITDDTDPSNGTPGGNDQANEQSAKFDPEPEINNVPVTTASPPDSPLQASQSSGTMDTAYPPLNPTEQPHYLYRIIFTGRSACVESGADT